MPRALSVSTERRSVVTELPQAMRSIVNDRISTSQTSTNRGPARANRAGARPARRRRSARPYRRLSLLELIRRIVERRDRRALREFHDFRTVFRHSDTGSLRLAEYLQQLREDAQEHAWAHDDPSVLDAAYDLTLDKFSHLPRGGGSDRSEQRKLRRPPKAHRAGLPLVLRSVPALCGRAAPRDSVGRRTQP